MDSKGFLHRGLDDNRLKEIFEDTGKPATPLTENQYRELEPMNPNQRKNWMRNKPCVCGSGRKFKKCCWSVYQ